MARVTHLAMARAGDVIIRALRTVPWHALALHLRCFVRSERYRHRGPACPEPLPVNEKANESEVFAFATNALSFFARSENAAGKCKCKFQCAGVAYMKLRTARELASLWVGVCLAERALKRTNERFNPNSSSYVRSTMVPPAVH